MWGKGRKVFVAQPLLAVVVFWQRSIKAHSQEWLCYTGKMLDQIVFHFFAALAVVSAILVVTRRNVVQSAIFLITALLATAGIFLQLHAEFLFIVQVILYAGGIMVLFVFVIMLINLDVSLHQVQFNRQSWLGFLLALVVGAELWISIVIRPLSYRVWRARAGKRPRAEHATRGKSSVQRIYAAV